MKKSSTQLVELIFMKFELFFDKFWNDKFKAEDAEASAIKYNLLKSEFIKAVEEFSEQRVEKAIDYIRDNCKFPPSIADFREACRNSGQFKISEEDALQAAVRRDFKNPIVKIAFDKIGAWEFSHALDKDLRAKFKWAYRDSVDQINCSENEQYDSSQNKPLLSSDKIEEPLPHQDGSFNATHALKFAVTSGFNVNSEGNLKIDVKKHENVQNLDNNIPANIPESESGKYSKWWSRSQYDPHKKGFDKKVHRERREYLLGLSEVAAMDRSRDDQIDRRTYVGEKEAWIEIQKNKREYAMRNPAGEEPAKNDGWKGKPWRKDIYD